mmetsp:Transcript_40772/g.101938  ORF Transcript_40772/g.101938 Transcript_40772/m.101938 type:complete len:120 (-) Transcript_40772:887-1246(-)
MRRRAEDLYGIHVCVCSLCARVCVRTRVRCRREFKWVSECVSECVSRWTCNGVATTPTAFAAWHSIQTLLSRTKRVINSFTQRIVERERERGMQHHTSHSHPSLSLFGPHAHTQQTETQ